MKRTRRDELRELERQWREVFGEPPVALASPRLMRELIEQARAARR